MANTASNWENLSIYYANLSPVYLCSSLFTILALFFTWWFSQNVSSNDADMMSIKEVIQSGVGKSKSPRISRKTAVGNIASQRKEKMDAERLATDKLKNDESMMRHIKTARQSAIEKQLTAGLSAEQLSKERETQANQLAAIYKLLKEKEEQFQIRSMDELQDQLRLYKS